MKLSLDALKERAEATASTELLATISGGTENSCHNSATDQALIDYIHAGQNQANWQIIYDFISIMQGN